MKRHPKQPVEGDAPLTRLVDSAPHAPDADRGWALDLLRVAPLHRPKPGERERVLFGIRASRAAAGRLWAIRLAATGAALIAATTLAWAELGQLPRWFPSFSRQRPAPMNVGARVVIARPPSPRTEATGHVESAVTAPASEAPRSSRHRLAQADAPDADTRLVVRAMRALRRDGDPALARELCGAYLQRHPSGALAEEALALSVEAAMAHRDADGPELGARYLRQYPNGPFSGLARQAIAPASARGR